MYVRTWLGVAFLCGRTAQQENGLASEFYTIVERSYPRACAGKVQSAFGELVTQESYSAAQIAAEFRLCKADSLDSMATNSDVIRPVEHNYIKSKWREIWI